MDYIDIHCHLDFPDYGEDIMAVFERMKEKKVGAITIGTDLESSKRAVRTAEEAKEKYGWPYVWACIGVHPADNHSEVFNEEEFEKLVQSPKVVGIGECGLDFFRVKPDMLEAEKERQEKLFRQQIEFAVKHDKPLMLHCRAAYNETLSVLKEYKNQFQEKLRGDSHFFAGNVEQAQGFVELGFSCSFTGVLTFTEDYHKVVASLPNDFIMTETDAPFATPVPYRGTRNEPAFVEEIVKKMAQIRNISQEEMMRIAIHNAERIFQLTLVQ